MAMIECACNALVRTARVQHVGVLVECLTACDARLCFHVLKLRVFSLSR